MEVFLIGVRRSRCARTALLALVVAAIVGAYVFFVTGGRGSPQPAHRHYYDMLADGFLDGHLYLPVPPSPLLLQQADPWDIRTSSRYWLWDAALYDGRYYLYFGPLPAVVAAGIKTILGRDTIVQDQQLVFAFVVGRFLVGAALLALVRRRLFPDLSPWVFAPALLVFGLANPTLYVLGRPAVYEAAIESAQFFLLLGLLAAFGAVRGGRTRNRELAFLGAAGCCWAAVLACRVSLVFAVAALVLLTALVAAPAAARTIRGVLLRLGLVGAPAALMLTALGLYNYARFGSATDFGTGYQLTARHYEPALSLVLPNLEAYLLRPFTLSCVFPFVGAPYYAKVLTPQWVLAVPGYAVREPLVGVLYAAPFVLFGVAAVAAALSRLRRHEGPSGTDTLYLWMVSCCAAIALLAGLPDLGVWTSTMRYLADIMPGALLLAVVGLWTLLAGRPFSWPRYALRATRAAGATLMFYTVTVGVLLGFLGGYGGAIRRLNPPLHAALVRTLSLCEPTPSAPTSPIK